MTIKGWVWVWVGMVLATGCGVSRGAFQDKHFTSGYGYDVRYRRGQDLLPTPWRLDNFERQLGEWVAKERGGYVTTYEFDNDGDGVKEAKVKAATYALRFEHRNTGGEIWLRNIPIARELRTKDLRVMMQLYVDDVAGASYEEARPREASSSREDGRRVVERRYAAAIVAEEAITLAGQPAYLATVDVANIDQLRLESTARSRRVQLVMWFASGTEGGGTSRQDRGDDRTYADRPTGVVGVTERYPVLAVAGYSNLPGDFERGLADFHDLLARVTIAGQSGIVAPVLAVPVAPGPIVRAPSPPAQVAARAP